jgi:hypothetical protein
MAGQELVLSGSHKQQFTVFQRCIKKVHIGRQIGQVGSDPAEVTLSFHGNGNENYQLGQNFLYIRKSYQQLG